MVTIFVLLFSRVLFIYLLFCFTSSAPSPSHVKLDPLFTWITKKLSNSINDVVNLMVQELESLLRIQAYRVPVWNTKDAIKE